MQGILVPKHSKKACRRGGDRGVYNLRKISRQEIFLGNRPQLLQFMNPVRL
jgi:hypothetical protein